ncbi:MAG: hypothetical protein IJH87_04415 [Atopobiaceae bacterium]|nr:hypothetical protein [Atopobiaceae bacterium]
MKKRFLSILAVLAVLCIALVGCGGSSKDYSADYVGDWELVEMSADSPDDAISADDLATLKDSGLVCVLTLNADGTFVIDFFGSQQMDGTWSFDGPTKGAVDLESEGKTQHSPLEYDPSTNRLAIIESSDTLYFERV